MSDSSLTPTQQPSTGDRSGAMLAMAFAIFTAVMGALIAAALFLTPFQLWRLAAALHLLATGFVLWMVARRAWHGQTTSSLPPRKLRIVGVGYLAAAALCAISAVLNREVVESVGVGVVSLGLGLGALHRAALVAAERPPA